MFTCCVTAAPTRYPPGEAHPLPAPAPLLTTFAAGSLPVNTASEVASRRLAAHSTGARQPLSSPLSLPSLSATPQLQPAQALSNCVAKNAFGDTIRHGTESPPLAGWPGLAYSPTRAAQPQEAQLQKTQSQKTQSQGDHAHRRSWQRRQTGPACKTSGSRADRRAQVDHQTHLVKTVNTVKTVNMADSPKPGVVSRRHHAPLPIGRRQRSVAQRALAGGVSDADFGHYHKPLWSHQGASGSETPPTDFFRQSPSAPTIARRITPNSTPETTCELCRPKKRLSQQKSPANSPSPQPSDTY